MANPQKGARFDLASTADGERKVDLFRKYGEAQVKQMDIEPSNLYELKKRRLNVTSDIKNVRFLTDVVLMFTGLTLVGTGVLGYGIGDLDYKIIIAGGATGLVSYLGMIITHHKIDKIRDEIAKERKKSHFYTDAKTAAKKKPIK